MYLRSQPCPGPTRQSRGFTITEMVLATFLTVLLGVLLAVAVATFARPAAEVDGRTRLALEASLAVEALARDLSGYLADNSGVPGTLTQYQFTSWTASSNGTTLVLNYQGTPPAPVTSSVTYMQQNYELVRIMDGSALTVAVHVTGFNVAYCDQNGSLDPAGSYLKIAITFTYPDPFSPRQGNPNFSGTYTLIGVSPPLCPRP